MRRRVAREPGWSPIVAVLLVVAVVWGGGEAPAAVPGPPHAALAGQLLEALVDPGLLAADGGGQLGDLGATALVGGAQARQQRIQRVGGQGDWRGGLLARWDLAVMGLGGGADAALRVSVGG